MEIDDARTAGWSTCDVSMMESTVRDRLFRARGGGSG
jgi:hypothetical protein